MNAAQLLALINDAAANGTEILDIMGENISELPPEIGNCTDLRILYASNNRLRTLPAEIGSCTSLEKLAVDQNRIDSLPSTIGNLANLKTLHIDGNNLVFLPTNIGDLASLRSLDIGDGGNGTGNPTTTLPPSIRNLSLFALDCHNCGSLVPESVADDGMYDPELIYDYLGVVVPT